MAQEGITQRRHFLGTAAATVLAAPALAGAQGAPRGLPGPVLLTVSGAIGVGNRGALDPALDQLMAKQKVSFTKAHVFDFAALTALSAVAIKPTLEYDSKPHALKGPLLLDVMRACDVTVAAKTQFFLRAIDGYAAQVSAADAANYRFIVATHLDGQPMAFGGLSSVRSPLAEVSTSTVSPWRSAAWDRSGRCTTQTASPT